MIREDLYIYLTFITNALVPMTPKGADQYYSDHQEIINRVARSLVNKLGAPQTSLYRGILLCDSDLDKDGNLIPDMGIRYLSFSEDPFVAAKFADISSDLSFAVRLQGKRTKGYVIKHTPDVTEILFHYSWSKYLGLHLIPHPAWSYRALEQQKEVMLKQSGTYYSLTAFNDSP